MLIMIIAYIISEIVIAFLFSLMAQFLYKKIGLDIKSIFKGVIERLFLTISIINNIPHTITFFSALKLATRLKHNEDDNSKENSFNDYYLVGNLLSVLIAIGYSNIYLNLNSITNYIKK